MAESNNVDTSLFLSELREQTRPRHEQLEEIPESKCLTSISLTDQDYTYYLSRLYPVIVAFEEQIFPIIGPVIPDLQQRRKSEALENDLRVLGVSVHELPTYRFDTSGLSRAEALGMMYVIEGSTLGGKFIAQNIEKTLGRSSANGAGYFSVYADTLGSKWKRFLDIFVDFVVQHEGQEAAIDAANSMFECLECWLPKTQR